MWKACNSLQLLKPESTLRSVPLGCSYKVTELAQDRLSPLSAGAQLRLSPHPHSLQQPEYVDCATFATMALGQRLCQWILQQRAQQVHRKSRPIEKQAGRSTSTMAQLTPGNRRHCSILSSSPRRYGSIACRPATFSMQPSISHLVIPPIPPVQSLIAPLPLNRTSPAGTLCRSTESLPAPLSAR